MSNKLNMVHLLELIVVDGASNFPEAASRLGINAAELNRRVRALEAALGAPIVEKRAGRVFLTEQARHTACILRVFTTSLREVFDQVPTKDKKRLYIQADLKDKDPEVTTLRLTAAVELDFNRAEPSRTTGNYPTGRSVMNSEDAIRFTKASAEKRAAKARRHAINVKPVIQELRAEGARTLKQLADGLMARGVLAPRGFTWSPASVRRVLTLLDQE
jgi:hypothetical protein